MQITLTAKLKLTLRPEQKALLDQTSLAYRNALNHASQVAFEHGKACPEQSRRMSQATKIQKLVYGDLHQRYQLPAQMACNVPRAVAASYKGLWQKLKVNQAIKAAHPERPIRRYKGLDKAPRFISRTLTYSYGRDFTFKTGQQVSIGTLKGRIVVPYQGYSRHLDYISQGATFGAARLYYQKSKKQYYLLVSLAIALPETTPESYSQVVGPDVGQRYQVVATNQAGETLFIPGRQSRHRKDHYARIRRELQRQDTRSVRRRLVALAGRERRFIADRNHCVSKHLLKRYPHSLIGVEDLRHIRQRTERRSGAKASSKQKQANRRRSQWSFAQLQEMLVYKAPLLGSLVVKIDADYTSQACTACRYTSKTNRPQAGLMFICQGCRYQLHSDLIGARNITMRTLLVWQDWISTGCLSATPDVSDCEAKAARLQRYAELRWSSDTNPDYTFSG